jgi:hypothetical protein
VYAYSTIFLKTTKADAKRTQRKTSERTNH